MIKINLNSFRGHYQNKIRIHKMTKVNCIHALNDNIKLHISGTHSITGTNCQYRTPSSLS